MVDGGSSDNFLQPQIAEFLKLPVEPGPCFKVLGQSMTVEGVVPNLSITLQGYELRVPVFLLPMAGFMAGYFRPTCGRLCSFDTKIYLQWKICDITRREAHHLKWLNSIITEGCEY